MNRNTEKNTKEHYDPFVTDNLSHKDFVKLSVHIQKNYGVKMPPHKEYFLQCRLKKRLKALKITSFKEYMELLFNDRNETEIQCMIDVVTTHKTDFFREKDHFDYMKSNIIPELSKKSHDAIKIWSAGSSTGEEMYTIAMTLIKAKEEQSLHFNYEISASDISNDCVKQAKKGIYKMEKITAVPLETKKRFFLKNKKPEKKLVKVIPELQKNLKLFTLNLLDKDYKIDEKFDIIFCRNTLIYFERHIQEQVLQRLCKQLKPNGYLFIGHSESVIGMNLPVKQLKPTILQRIK